MAFQLPKWERYVYFVIWTSSVAFAFYRVFMDGERLSSSDSGTHHFDEGWKIFNRKRDISDSEWEIWMEFLPKLIPWMFLHLCLAEILRIVFIEALPLCYLLTTMGFLICHFPAMVSAFFIVELSLFFIAMTTASKPAIWALGAFFLVCVNNDVFSLMSHLMNENEIHLIYVSNGWLYIRCLYFVLSEAEEDMPRAQQFINYLAYIFYLPSFFLGPFIPYENFKYQMCVSSRRGTRNRVIVFFLSLSVYATYYITYETALHFLYCNAMNYNIKDFLENGWTVSGVGICLANFFYIKYVIIYGLAGAFASAEDYETPHLPKCIYRIHLYSKMWRHFDRGFYIFLFRCIYSPICCHRGTSIARRSLASFICFIFVYLWHGGTTQMFYWSMFNYVGLVIESIFKYFWLHYKWKISILSPSNIRRLEALAAAPLWLLAVISNLIFFGGYEMGLLLVQQLAQGSLLFYITLIVIAYSMCQVSIDTDNFDNKTK